MAKGIQIMAGDTKCGSPPCHILFPHTLCGGYIIWRYTVRCRKLILGRDIGLGCKCAIAWYNLDLTFDLAIVTLSLKILSGQCLRNHMV